MNSNSDNEYEIAEQVITMKQNAIRNNKRQEIINGILSRLNPRRLFDVYLKALCLKSCNYKINDEFKLSNFTITNSLNRYKTRNSKGDLLGLSCNSIFHNNKKYTNVNDLKIKPGMYFEIIKLVKSQHKDLVRGRFDPKRTFNTNNHLIVLFISDEGEWMTAGFDPAGITSPDRYFNMKCNYLLKQEYDFPEKSGSELRTNRNKRRINESIDSIYTDKQFQLSVVNKFITFKCRSICKIH